MYSLLDIWICRSIISAQWQNTDLGIFDKDPSQFTDTPYPSLGNLELRLKPGANNPGLIPGSADPL